MRRVRRPGRWPGAEGAGPVERLAGAGALSGGLVAAHCVQLGDGDPALLAQAGVGVAHCPRSNEYLHCGRAPVDALHQAGVPVGLGTDSPASGGDYDVRAEARACARIHGDAAGQAEGLLSLATIGGARVLGLDAEVGTLTPGKRADLVALRTLPGSPRDPWAAALAAGTEVATVVIDGAVALEGDRPAGIDAGDVETAAARARRRLW